MSHFQVDLLLIKRDYCVLIFISNLIEDFRTLNSLGIDNLSCTASLSITFNYISIDKLSLFIIFYNLKLKNVDFKTIILTLIPEFGLILTLIPKFGLIFVTED